MEMPAGHLPVKVREKRVGKKSAPRYKIAALGGMAVYTKGGNRVWKMGATGTHIWLCHLLTVHLMLHE